ncbi:MAG: DUF359 domain-containing protein [Acidilobaceae archaeon]|nr:DUF359 domain-containing protein [Acidilobaceae archaeon]
MKLRLPERHRPDFAAAWGRVEREVPAEGKLVCVGDYVSSLCAKRGSSVLVLDGVTRRTEAFEAQLPGGLPRYSVINEKGTLSLEAYALLCSVIERGESAVIEVSGEEDMLALAAISCLRPGWSAVYGIPGKGSCIVPYDPVTVRVAQTRVLQLVP